MSFAFGWKPLFWCLSIGTAQTSFLFNSFVKFMFSFTNTIPGIILSTLQPNFHTIIISSLQRRKLRHGEDVKLAQVCEFCIGSMVTILQLGKNFIEMECYMQSLYLVLLWNMPLWSLCWMLVNWGVSLIYFPCSLHLIWPLVCPLLASHSWPFQVAVS